MEYAAASIEQPVGWLQHDTRDLTRDDEAELVERAKRDPLQFAPLYDRYFLQIYRFAYSRVGQQGAEEDVTSEVFMKALAAMPRYEYRGRPFVAWLYRIAVNTITDRGRMLHPSQPIEEVCDLSVGSSTEELALRRDEIHRIWTLVGGLPRDQRTAFVLRFLQDMRVIDIAAAMGKSNGAVKLLIHRAVGHLRAEAQALRPAV